MTDAAPTKTPVPLRTEQTPCLLFPELYVKGGGLQRSVQERASLFAEHWERVLLLTTGFTRQWYRTPVALKERGSLHPRVTIRNFFAHSAWMKQLGVPPEAAYATGEDDVEARPQSLLTHEPFRLADFRRGATHAFRFRYFDRDGRPFLTTYPGDQSKNEQRAVDPAGNPVSWHAIVAAWVDEEIAGLPAPRPLLPPAGGQRPGAAGLEERHPQDRVAAQLPLQRPGRPPQRHPAELPPALRERGEGRHDRLPDPAAAQSSVRTSRGRRCRRSAARVATRTRSPSRRTRGWSCWSPS